MNSNPLLEEKGIDFLLHDVLGAAELFSLPDFAEHNRATIDLVLGSARRISREVLLPAFRAMDAEAPSLEGGRIRVHPAMRDAYRALVELGLISAPLPPAAGGMGLPMMAQAAALVQVFAANVSAGFFPALTSQVAQIVGMLGAPEIQEAYGQKLVSGEWTGTLAFTEAQAGSDITEIRTSATKAAEGHYLLHGEKIFISAGDHDLTDNVVHVVIARIEGAPPGPMGLSLFVVPRLRPEGGALVPNDVQTTGLLHKLGWRGLPSAVLRFGEEGDCRGFLLGEANQAIVYLMGALGPVRLLFSMTSTASALAGYRASLEYARDRVQSRPIAPPDPTKGPVAIIEHADVRRMLLRQKAIVEGALALVLSLAKYADVAMHGATPEARGRAHTLFELIAPAAKGFTGERGFESNALAIQVLGGHGASVDHPVEAYLRDQKLNTLHAGTTGTLALDLLGRQALADGGAPIRMLGEEIGQAVSRARKAGVDGAWCDAIESGFAELAKVTMDVAGFAQAGDPEKMLRHATDYMDLFGTVVIGWQWLLQAAAARECQSSGGYEAAFLEGKLGAAQYWMATEMPRIAHLASLCRTAEDSYARMQSDWF
ncbi:MAG: acyl-CoA dehydrogenase [Polyangiaceae bacterium]